MLRKDAGIASGQVVRRCRHGGIQRIRASIPLLGLRRSPVARAALRAHRSQRAFRRADRSRDGNNRQAGKPAGLHSLQTRLGQNRDDRGCVPHVARRMESGSRDCRSENFRDELDGVWDEGLHLGLPQAKGEHLQPASRSDGSDNSLILHLHINPQGVGLHALVRSHFPLQQFPRDSRLTHDRSC